MVEWCFANIITNDIRACSFSKKRERKKKIEGMDKIKIRKNTFFNLYNHEILDFPLLFMCVIDRLVSEKD